VTILGIRYLMGRSVAAKVSAPRQPEWPPHPGRVFMAMAAAHFETRGDEYEREALEWLEQAGAPAVRASGDHPRSFVETYVPVNDSLSGNAGAGLRARQARSFPAARPSRDRVYLVWSADVPSNLRAALEQLCSKVTRIGHSSSLVQMWLAEGAEELGAEWHPADLDFDRRMRIAEPGTLAYLRKAFNQEAIERYDGLARELESARGGEKTTLKRRLAEEFPGGQPKAARPQLPCWKGYASFSAKREDAEPRSGPFEPNIIVFTKNKGRSLGLESTLQLTSALRDAAMKAAGKKVPEWLSGHQPDGSPTLKPHVAFFPLPFVGTQYADGHIMGLALAIPRELNSGGRGEGDGTAEGHRALALWKYG
jgi:CRISPR-associated protein Csb2